MDGTCPLQRLFLKCKLGFIFHECISLASRSSISEALLFLLELLGRTAVCDLDLVGIKAVIRNHKVLYCASPLSKLRAQPTAPGRANKIPYRVGLRHSTAKITVRVGPSVAVGFEPGSVVRL